jgi:trk system potassium uptake protein TrkA
MQSNPTADDRSIGGGGNVSYVLGGGRLGVAVARRLRTDGHEVELIDESNDPSEIPGRRGDPADVRVLEEAGVSDTSTVVVATRSDRRNFLIAQLVRANFDAARVVVLANTPDRYELIASAGHDPVCATSVLTDELAENV